MTRQKAVTGLVPRPRLAEWAVRALASLLLLGAMILGAASLAQAASNPPVKSLLEMRQKGVVVQKWDLSCGAAALATLLSVEHGDEISEKEIATALIKRDIYLENPDKLREQQGFSMLDLKRFVDNRGYRGIGYRDLSLEDLSRLAPILVTIDHHGYSHFAVFRGLMGNRVLLADPAWGNRTMLVDQFEDAWLAHPRLGKVGFVVALRDGTRSPSRQEINPADFPMLK